MSTEAKVSLPKLSKQDKADQRAADQRAKDEAAIEAFKKAIKDFADFDMVSLVNNGLLENGVLYFAYQCPHLRLPNPYPEEILDLIKQFPGPEVGIAIGALEASERAQEKFIAGLQVAIRDAVDALSYQCLAEVLPSWVEYRDEVIYETDKDPVKIKHTLKDGASRRTVLSKRGSGQASKWARKEIQEAVISAIGSLPKGRAITYDKVNAVLKIGYPDKAPASGESLRQLLIRFNLDWKTLKRESVIHKT